MSPSGYNVLVVYNPATGTGAQMSFIAEDSGDVIVRQPLDGEKDTRGRTIYSGDSSRLDLMCYDSAGQYATLKAFMDARTIVRAVMIGPAGAVLWEEDVRVMVRKTKAMATGRLNRFGVTLTLNGGEHAIYDGINVLQVRRPYPSAFPATGWTFTGTFEGATAGPYPGSTNLELELDAGNTLYTDLVIPASGVRATLAIESSARTASFDIGLQARSFAGDTIETATAEVDSSDRTSVSLVLPAGTYTLRVFLVAPGAPEADVFIAAPSLRFDGSEVWTLE